MKSKADIAGHPIHPMLVTIPIGGYLLTLVFDLVHAATGEFLWWDATRPVLLVSVIGALVAAVPGLVDLVSVVPKGKARRVGVTHMVLNLIVTALFAVNAWIRWDWPADRALDGTPGLALTVIGAALLGVSGFLGWMLVQTWHVGVLERGERGPAEHALADPHTSPG